MVANMVEAVEVVYLYGRVLGEDIMVVLEVLEEPMEVEVEMEAMLYTIGPDWVLLQQQLELVLIQ